MGTHFSLLIEPVWNWNDRSVLSTPSISNWLLIEPVWNWNYAVIKLLSSISALLIEPVWNWNKPFLASPKGYAKSFNRTSLELKPKNGKIGCWFTSLLIEPVWNWNYLSRIFARVSPCILLIEPVWNWNRNRDLFRLRCRKLLIEPVWNWNKRWWSLAVCKINF